MKSKKYNSYKPQNIRYENIKHIISLIKNSETNLSRADISRKISLSTPSVSAIINDLIEKKIVQETKDIKIESSVGRKPILLKLNDNCGYIIGILISKKILTLALANYSGKIIKNKRFNLSNNSKHPIDILKMKIDNVLEENNVDKTELLSISISFPGIFDHLNQKIKFAPNIGIWQNESIVEKLKYKYQCQILMENNVNNAVLAEKWKGNINNENAIYIKLGDGIAAGILINGKIYKGFNNLAGEIGFSVTDSSHLDDKVSEVGSFEQRFNSEKILKVIENDIGEKFNYSQLIDLLEKNQKLDNLINQVNENIVILLINIISILSPQILVIGGQYSAILSHYIDQIKERIKNNVPFAPEILISKLGEKVYYLGAIANSLQNIEEELIKKYFID